MERSKDTVSVALFSVAAVGRVGDAMAAAGVSSSFTVTVTEGRVGLPKKPPEQAPLGRLWPRVATSSTPLASCPAVTVTVCGVLQLNWSKARLTIRGVGLPASSATSAWLLVARRFTKQPPPLAVVGSAVRRTVYVPTLAFAPPPAAGSSSSASVVRFRAMYR